MRLLTPSDVDAVLSAHGLRASRALGQHFLADPNTARRIARLAAVGPGDQVLEIGPGIGSLTLALAETGADVLAIERDRHVLPALTEVLTGIDNVRVVEGDAFEIDGTHVLGAPTGAPGTWVMVSNLPYNIATPLLVHYLEDVPQVGRFFVMVQREVAQRLAAQPGQRTAGSVSVKVAYHAEASLIGRVPPTVFVPRPRVESELLSVVRRSQPAVAVSDPDQMFRLVRAGFAQRRKTLGRALRGVLGVDARTVIEAAGVDPRARAESLSLEEWAALTEASNAPGTVDG